MEKSTSNASGRKALKRGKTTAGRNSSRGSKKEKALASPSSESPEESPGRPSKKRGDRGDVLGNGLSETLSTNSGLQESRADTSSSADRTDVTRVLTTVPGAISVAGIAGHVDDEASEEGHFSEGESSEAFVELQAELVDDAESRAHEAELERLREVVAERNSQMAEIGVAEAVKEEDTLDPESAESSRRHKKLYLVACFACLVTVMTVIAIVGLRSSDESPNISLVPKPMTFTDPTEEPTQAPLYSCFQSSTSLQEAVYLYLDPTISAEGARERLLETRGPRLNDWCVGLVDDFSGLFGSFGFIFAAIFNEDISEWDTSNARSMDAMFYGTESFDQDISKWQIGRVTNMESMFYGASSFNQDLSGWNTSSVVWMGGMFELAASFQGDVSTWDTSKVTNMGRMFKNATSFNQDISSWDISNVASNSFDSDRGFSETGFKEMFQGATNFRQDLCDWGPLMRFDADTTGMFADTNCPDQSDPERVNGVVTPLCFPCTTSPD